MEQQQVDSRRWYALGVILLPTLLISLNTYMIQVALPSMQYSLNASFSEAQLIVTGFSLGLAVALIISGKLGDIYGRKRMLLIGVSGFTVMAVLGGVTSDPALLIVIRIVQGLAAALIQPQVLSTLQVSFLPKEKGLVFGIYGAMIGFGFAFGFILGGTIVNWNPFDLGWRTVFFFNVPFGLLVLLLMPIVPETRAEQAHSIDWTGSFLLLIGLFLLIYPLSEGQKQGWPLWIFGCLMLALFVLFTFIWVENRKGKQGALPLVDLSIFRDRTFSAGLATVLVLYLSMFSFFFILSYYMQFGLHYSVQDTSMVFLPIGIGFFLTSLISSRMVKRWGMSVLKIGALMMGSCSLLLMLELNVDVTNLLDPRNILILLIYGFGLGMATTPLVNVTLSSVPPKITGTGSGLITTFMYFANSLGVALIGILFSASLKHSLLEADLADYVRAFSFSLAAIGGLAFTGFLCLCFLRERKL
ncbi:MULTISPECIES: MFS transporter [Paenibacillus]|uniref:MFS transporter n=1 Tax=Paenibacillus TaxID=44249 RepID=UPI0003E21635|nr:MULTISPECIES: MFS transporter [Paenibacillus]ETT68357.1 transmembrane efflux protein [Paenibacillus sp. FSL H8-237]OME25696.1 MFS transporter [Paenibacillus odorifer]OME43925.1 MFS transporter [Paenibacillus odorifer]OME50627.1 MFS transporter [Paenibacillus odorifer]OME57931.1 MFS transporter [Paenibacillus odorifer]